MQDLLTRPTFVGVRTFTSDGYVQQIWRTDIPKSRIVAMIYDQASGLNKTNSEWVAAYGDWRFEGSTLVSVKEQLFRHLDQTLTYGEDRAQSWDKTDVHPLLA